MANQDNLPVSPLQGLVAAGRRNRTSASGGGAGGSGFLKFDGKLGGWGLGRDGEPVDQEDVIINSGSLEHGWVRWGELPPTKVFTSVFQPPPARLESIEAVDRDGKTQTFHAQQAYRLSGKFVAEDLADFIFETSSMGGCERVEELRDMIFDKADESPYCYPRIRLNMDWYRRAGSGKVFKPVFELVGWCDMEGNPEGQPDRIQGGTRKRAAKPAPEPEAPAPEAEAEADRDGEEEAPPPAPRRRRRRAA